MNFVIIFNRFHIVNFLLFLIFNILFNLIKTVNRVPSVYKPTCNTRSFRSGKSRISKIHFTPNKFLRSVETRCSSTRSCLRSHNKVLVKFIFSKSRQLRKRVLRSISIIVRLVPAPHKMSWWFQFHFLKLTLNFINMILINTFLVVRWVLQSIQFSKSSFHQLICD